MIKNKKGFSLVEVLAVIALMGIIALIGIAAYGGIREKVSKNNYKTLEKELLVAGEKYTAKTGTQVMTVQDLLDAGLLSADSSGTYKGFDNNDLSCLVIDNTTANPSLKKLDGTDLTIVDFDQLSTYTCEATTTNTVQNILDSSFDLNSLYTIEVYENGYLISDSNWHNNATSVVAKIVKVNDFENACENLGDTVKASLKFKEIFKNNCTIKSGVKQTLIISNKPETKGNNTSSDDSIYEMTYSNIEGDLVFEYELSSTSETDSQYTLMSNHIKIDNTVPEVKVKDENNECTSKKYNITVKDSLSGVNSELLDSDDPNSLVTYVYYDNKKASLNGSSTIKIDNRRRTTITVQDYAGNKIENIPIDSNGIVITFDANGGNLDTSESTKKVYLDETYGTLPDLSKARTGYRFDGWYTSKTGGTKVESTTTVTDSVSCSQTLYAHWTQMYTVSYNVNDSSDNTPISQSGYADESITLAKAITKDNNSENYTVSYDINGGDSCSDCGDVSATKTTTYLFAGWAEDSTSGTVYNANSSYTIPNKNVTMYATWNENSTTTSVTFPQPVKDGYTLTGWYTSSSGGTLVGNGGENYTPTSSIKLYAQWQDNSKFTLTYSSGDTSLNNSSATCTVSNMITDTITITRDTYIDSASPECYSSTYNANALLFISWKDKNTGTIYYPGDSIDFDKLTGNIDLVAQWEKIDYYVRYVNPKTLNFYNQQWYLIGNGYPTIASSSESYDDDYRFLYWKNYDNTSSSTTYYPGDQYTDGKNITLFGYWEKYQYDVHRYDYTITGTVAKVIVKTTKSVSTYLCQNLSDGFIKSLSCAIAGISETADDVIPGDLCDHSKSTCYYGIDPQLKNLGQTDYFTLNNCPTAIEGYTFNNYMGGYECGSSYTNPDQTNLPDIYLWATYTKDSTSQEIETSTDIDLTKDTKTETNQPGNVTQKPRYKVTYIVDGKTVHTESTNEGSITLYKYTKKGYKISNWSCGTPGSTISISSNLTCSATSTSVCIYDKSHTSESTSISKSIPIFGNYPDDFTGYTSVSGSGICYTFSGSSYSGSYAYQRKAEGSEAASFGVSGMSAQYINQTYGCNYHQYWCQ